MLVLYQTPADNSDVPCMPQPSSSKSSQSIDSQCLPYLRNARGRIRTTQPNYLSQRKSWTPETNLKLPWVV